MLRPRSREGACGWAHNRAEKLIEALGTYGDGSGDTDILPTRPLTSMSD
jgi:hypothetical protein